MPSFKTVNRRTMMVTIVGSVATGCLGRNTAQPGIIDGSDVSVRTEESGTLKATSVQGDNNRGLKLSTEESIADGRVVGTVPTRVPNAPASTVSMRVDVDSLDDDAEIEIRFHGASSSYRTVYIGNEYAAKDQGVLATDPGSGYTINKPLAELPGSKSNQSKLERISKIEFIIRDGDFSGTIWNLWFQFEDRTIVLL